MDYDGVHCLLGNDEVHYLLGYNNGVLWDVAAEELDVLVALVAAVAPNTRPLRPLRGV